MVLLSVEPRPRTLLMQICWHRPLSAAHASTATHRVRLPLGGVTVWLQLVRWWCGAAAPGQLHAPGTAAARPRPRVQAAVRAAAVVLAARVTGPAAVAARRVDADLGLATRGLRLALVHVLARPPVRAKQEAVRAHAEHLAAG